MAWVPGISGSRTPSAWSAICARKAAWAGRSSACGIQGDWALPPEEAVDGRGKHRGPSPCGAIRWAVTVRSPPIKSSPPRRQRALRPAGPGLPQIWVGKEGPAHHVLPHHLRRTLSGSTASFRTRWTLWLCNDVFAFFQDRPTPWPGLGKGGTLFLQSPHLSRPGPKKVLAYSLQLKARTHRGQDAAEGPVHGHGQGRQRAGPHPGSAAAHAGDCAAGGLPEGGALSPPAGPEGGCDAGAAAGGLGESFRQTGYSTKWSRPICRPPSGACMASWRSPRLCWAMRPMR